MTVPVKRFMIPRKISAMLMVFLVLFGFSGVSGAAAKICVDSRVVKATVYHDRATITREAVAEVPAGAGVIVLADLPASVLTDSLRVRGFGTGDAGLVIGSLTHRIGSGADLIAPREQELAAEIEALQDKRTGVEGERRALAAQRAFMESMGQQARLRVGEAAAELRLNPEQWLEAAGVIARSLSDNAAADLALHKDLRELDRDLDALNREMAGLQTGLRDTLTVRVPVEAQSAGRVRIRLQYQVPGVSWKPVYDARLDTATSGLSLVQYGAVRQNTGEDWEDVALTLSTASPHRGGQLPGPDPLWIDLVAPPRKTSDLGKERVLSQSVSDSAQMKAARAPGADTLVESEADMAAAQIRTSGFVVEYAVPGRVRVPADGTQVRLLCGTFDTDAGMQIHIRPRISTDAFLVCRTVLKGEAPLLPGPVSLFRDGAYMGHTRLPLVRPGEARDIGFGVDDRISVTRSILADKRSDPALFNREHHLERHTVTTITNQGQQDMDIVVLEATPAPRHDRITVEILKTLTTPDYRQDADDIKGLLRWRMQLAAGRETRITLAWKVSWPHDRVLHGL